MDDGGEKTANLNSAAAKGESQVQRSSAARNPLALSCAFVCLGVDLLSKHWAKNTLQPGHAYALLPPLLQMNLVTNSGAAFSMGSHNSMVVSLIATVVLALLIFFYWRTLERGFPTALEQFGLAVLIGAASGNLIERYASGHVTDFLEFMFIRFPVFNVADVLIDVGIGLVILSSLFNSGKRARVDNP